MRQYMRIEIRRLNHSIKKKTAMISMCSWCQLYLVIYLHRPVIKRTRRIEMRVRELPRIIPRVELVSVPPPPPPTPPSPSLTFLSAICFSGSLYKMKIYTLNSWDESGRVRPPSSFFCLYYPFFDANNVATF